MTPQQQNEALWQWDGWKFRLSKIPATQKVDTKLPLAWHSPMGVRWEGQFGGPPIIDHNYLAYCREKLTHEQGLRYSSILETVLENEVRKDEPGCIPDICAWELINATLDQQREALVWALGLWKD